MISAVHVVLLLGTGVTSRLETVGALGDIMDPDSLPCMDLRKFNDFLLLHQLIQ